MTEEEIKNKISEHKECCKKLAEEYRQRYNEDKTDKLALNMFYHNVIAYNNFETVLATIEDRNSMIMCFSNPPILTEETVEVDTKRITELEKENLYYKDIVETNSAEWEEQGQRIVALEKENAELKEKLKPENCLKLLAKEGYIKFTSEQLTKAKEIIREFVEWATWQGNSKCPSFKSIQDKAEQFLNEVKK